LLHAKGPKKEVYHPNLKKNETVVDLNEIEWAPPGKTSQEKLVKEVETSSPENLKGKKFRDPFTKKKSRTGAKRVFSKNIR